MVFPQGKFSAAAMEVLRARNFHAAVNTIPHPLGEVSSLTIRDAIQPATLRYGGFPLFLRRYVRGITLPEVALQLFFGRPLFIVEHHEIFKDYEALTQLVSGINSLAPEIRWTNLQAAIENSWLGRSVDNAAMQIRTYSNLTRIENNSKLPQQYSVEWPAHSDPTITELSSGAVISTPLTEIAPSCLRFSLDPGSSKTLLAAHRNGFGCSDTTEQFSWTARVFLRRRLSEIRDNYLSKNPKLLSIAKSVSSRFIGKALAGESG